MVSPICTYCQKDGASGCCGQCAASFCNAACLAASWHDTSHLHKSVCQFISLQLFGTKRNRATKRERGENDNQNDNLNDKRNQKRQTGPLGQPADPWAGQLDGRNASSITYINRIVRDNTLETLLLYLRRSVTFRYYFANNPVFWKRLKKQHMYNFAQGSYMTVLRALDENPWLMQHFAHDRTFWQYFRERHPTKDMPPASIL